MSQDSRRHLIATSVFFVLGLWTLFYRGPGWHFTRGTLGDVLIVPFLFHLVSIVWRAPLWQRATAIAALSVGIELAQWAHLTRARPTSAEAVITGSTFDGWDLVAYAIGLTPGIVLERRWRQS